LSNFIFLILLFFSCRGNNGTACDEFYFLSKEKGRLDTLEYLKMVSDFLKRESHCIDAFLTRADLLNNLDKPNEAKIDYLTVLKIDSINVYTFYKLGILLYQSQKYDSSIEMFQQAIDIKTKGDYFFDYTDSKVSNMGRYDISAKEIIFQQGLVYYYQRSLSKALNNFNYCIYNNYNLADAFLYRAAISIESNGKINLNYCKDLEFAKLHGSIEATQYLKTHCN
jgi:tetratricopeptide (TPR) repeat protein